VKTTEIIYSVTIPPNLC